MTEAAYSSIHKWGLRALAGVAAVVVLVLIVFEAINRAPGRWLASDLLDGREIGRYGTLELEGLSGRLLSRVTVRHIALRDADGIWLEAKNVELAWRGLAVFGGRLEIQSVEASQIEIHWRPVQRPASTTGGASLSITLDRIDLPSVVLAEPVLGRRFELVANAAISDLSQDDGTILVHIRGRNGTADELTLDLWRSASGELAGDLGAQAPADGLVARALGMPERSFTLDGTLGGLFSSGTSELTLAIDEQAAARGVLQWDRSGWSLEGESRPGAFSRTNVSLPARLRLAARGQGRSPWPEILQLEGDALSVEFARRSSSEYVANLIADPVALGWLDRAVYQVEAVVITGLVDRRTRSFDGDVALSRPAAFGYAADRVTGPLTLAHRDGVWSFDANFTAGGLSAPSALLQRQFGSDPVLVAVGQWYTAEDQLSVSRISLRGNNLAVESAGELRPRAGSLNVDGDIQLRDVAELNTILSGPASARIQLRRDQAQAIGLEAELDLSETTLPEWCKTMLAGLRLAVRAGPGNTFTPAVEIEAEGLALSARVATDTETGAWQLAGEAAVLAPSTEAVDIMGAAVGAFDVEFGGEEINVRTEISMHSLAFEAVSLDRPRLRSEIHIAADEIDARWWLDAQSSAGPLALAGDIRREGNDGFAGDLAGRVGPARAEARVGLAGDAFNIDLDLVAAETQPRWDLSAELLGQTGDLSRSTLNAVLNGRGIVLPGGAVDRAMIGARGRLDRLGVEGEASGLLGEPFTLDLAGTASVMGGSRGAEVSISGELGGETVTSIEPIAIAPQSDGWTVAGAVSVGDGRVRASASTQPPGVSLQVQASDIPARFIAALAALPELSGRLDGEADLALRDHVITGETCVVARQLAPVEIEGVEPVDLEIGVQAGTAISVGARLNSESLTGRADLAASRSLRINAMDDLLMVSTWRGTAELHGDITSLSALVLPSGETLTGQFDMALVKPAEAQSHWTGDVAVADARYNSVRSGFDLSAVNLNAAVSSGGVELVSASAIDRFGGRVDGSGRLTWQSGEAEGALRADFAQLRLVDRSDVRVTASGHADISLGDREVLVTGRSEIHEARISPPENGPASIPQIEVEEINQPADAAPARRPFPIRLDYQIAASRNLFISARTFETEWSADLAVAGRLNALQIAGDANLLAGQAFLLNRPFRLRSGRVRFDGAPMEAGIALTASHQRPGFEAIIDVGGTLQTLTVTMRSVPELPQDEIFARLLFDRSTASLSAFEAAQLAAQLSGRNLLTMVARLREAARIDRLNVSSGENGDLVVTGGRQFGDRLYVELESGSADALSSARVEWSLTPDISILSRLTGDTDASVSIRWRTEYD